MMVDAMVAVADARREKKNGNSGAKRVWALKGEEREGGREELQVASEPFISCLG